MVTESVVARHRCHRHTMWVRLLLVVVAVAVTVAVVVAVVVAGL